MLVAVALLAWAGVAGGQPDVRPGPDDIHETVQRILASDEFASARDSDVLARVMERLMDVLRRVLEALQRAFGGVHLPSGASGLAARITHYAVLGIAAAIVVYLLFLLCRWIARRLSAAEGEAGPFAMAAVVEPIVETPGRVSVLRRRAAEARAQGDLRQAIRYYFLAYLAYLSALGLVHFSPRYTNGDYARELAGTPSRRDAFRSAAGLFELAWYGGVPPASDEVAAVEALSGGVESGAA